MSMNYSCSVKNALIDPVTLTFQPQNYTISRVSNQGHSLHQVWTVWDHLFFKNYATIIQTEKQTDGQTSEYFTHADRL